MKKNPLSKTQIDRLGDRLKAGSHTEEDLRLLDDYRRSFDEAYEEVVRKIREYGELPTGRKAKTKQSITEKLKRESIRLSQMQDIAGCRIVVTDVVEQDRCVALLTDIFPDASVIDRRDKPSHGYRAVHVIVKVSEKFIEIQVRTFFQHLWAQLSEKASDVIDPAVKYGGGSDELQKFLFEVAKAITMFEQTEKKHLKIKAAHEMVERTAAAMPKYMANFLKSNPHVRELQDVFETQSRWVEEISSKKKLLAFLLEKLKCQLDEMKRKER